MRALPGLNDLRVFEIAARLENFRQAAEQLHLTHGAVSHRIKALEEQLDVPLFERIPGGVKLTPSGHELYAATREVLDVLRQTTDRLSKRLPQTETLSLTSLPSHTSGWLSARLPRFHRQYPALRLKMDVTPDLVSLEKTAVDIALRFGPGQWSGLQAEKYLDDYYYPVATPELLAQLQLQTPADLLCAPLIHHTNVWSGGTWQRYFTAVGHSGARFDESLHLDDSYVATQLALAGSGVLLGRHTLVADALAEGRLQRVFDCVLRSQWQHYFVTSPLLRHTPRVAQFHDWLFDESRAFDAAHAEMLAAATVVE